MRKIALLAAVAALAACGTATNTNIANNTNATNNTNAVVNANVAANNQAGSNAAQTANAPATSATATNPPTAEALDSVARISINEMRDMMAKNTAVVVDVRGESQRNAGYIKGSIWIPETELAARAGELPRDKKIITYCS